MGIVLVRIRIRVRVLGPTFDTLFMLRVSVRVICCYDVIINMCTPVRSNLLFYGGVDHTPVFASKECDVLGWV